MNDKIKEIEVTRLDMKEGEVLVVTIKSSGIQRSDVEGIREGFKKRFPNNDVMILGISEEDSLTFSVVSAEKGAELKSGA